MLKSDQESLELEKKIKAKVEYRKHVLGSKYPKNIRFHSNCLEFAKKDPEKYEIEF